MKPDDDPLAHLDNTTAPNPIRGLQAFFKWAVAEELLADLNLRRQMEVAILAVDPKLDGTG